MDQVEVADIVQGSEESAPVEAVEVQSASDETPAAEAVTPAPVETPPAEKMIPQSQVSKIAAREARSAAEKARNEMRAEFERQQAVAGSDKPASSMGGMPQMTDEQLQQKIMEAAHRMSTQMTANKMAQDFESKINAEIEADPNFGDLYDSLNITQHPELVIWMNGMDNSAKVVKDLAENPSKFANILMLAKSGVPGLAQKELKKLSDSIKTNLAAQAQPAVKEPLNQLSASSVGADNGLSSVSDYQKQEWLRG